MTRKLRFLFLLLFVSIAGTAFGQGGEISGTVLDDSKEPVIGALVKVTVGGITKGGGQTDEDGKYVVKPLDGGRYDVEITYPSYKTNRTTGVIVSNNKVTLVNANLELDAKKLNEVTVTSYKVPLIDVANPGPRNVVLSEQIEKMPTRTTDGVAATAPGVYSGADGLKVAGGRTDGTVYIVDGIVTRGRDGNNVSQNSIDQIEVMTSGLSAKYGDAIGGVVAITTKGASERYRGNVLLEHSVDGYNHNLANAGISGPIYSKKLEGGGKKPIIGFRLGVDAIYDEDSRPTYGGNYVLKPEVREQLEQNPIVLYPTPTGRKAYRQASEYVRLEDMEIQKIRNAGDEIRGIANGKLDFQLAENLNLTAGGSFNYNRYRNHGESQYAQSIFSPAAITLDERKITRGYLRLTQRFGKQPAAGTDEKKPLISNAFYTLQADYTTDRFNREHPDHGKDFFKYGYLGKFNTDYRTSYLNKIEDSSGLQATVFVTDREAVRTTYQRSDINPILANYATTYFNTIGTLPQTVDDVRNAIGMINGDLPDGTYQVFSSIGNSVSQYRYDQNDQFAVAVDASFDFQPSKTRHAIQFGLSYQQRVERFYGTGSQVGGGIWSYMRQLTNAHIQNDFTNPVYIVNGQRYNLSDLRSGRFSLSPTDTVLFDRISIDTAQTTFDRNLRAKLNQMNPNSVSKTDYLNVDQYDPSMYSLDMFSADELLNNGNNFVNYQGYDYTGKKQSGQVNFNDFFTRKDANGNFTRDIGAYRPNYIAGYILDQFQFKDINFNVGLRIDRFDANTKVLKDPYSIYEVRTLGDARSTARNVENGGHPANIGDDYVVYVGSNESATPAVVGYRNGDDWYDPFGRFIEDPSVLKSYTGGTDPVPFLVDRTSNISDEDFDPNTSFTDYTPQVNVMPRISFSFPISEVALFYAHYDVIVQRPRFGQYSTPLDYFYLANNNGQILSNSDLKPEKMFDYEVGFQQQLTQRSAITLSGFYKERKDMIQIRPYLYAVPKTYYVYGNRDFSTTKGLTMKYDLRRFNHLLMNVAYTLQFAEGSGSGAASGNGGSTTFFSNNGILASFISASLPNLRYSTPLDYDSRHMIVVNADYRYTDNEGPVVAGNHILQNAGVNFIFNTRSGEPYTRFSAPPPRRNVTGNLNGSRYAWHYNLDLRVDKDFNLSFGKKKPVEGARAKNPLVLNAYVLITNVLNTRDVIDINGYTGRPDEDGYITSAVGVQQTRNQTDQQSYIDLYSISSGIEGAASPQTNYNPRNINLPRRINVGLQLDF